MSYRYLAHATEAEKQAYLEALKRDTAKAAEEKKNLTKAAPELVLNKQLGQQ